MPTENKIVSLPQLQTLREEWKKADYKVVFTNGCFDIVHLGHIDYLEKAAALGNKLIVGLNTDNSVTQLKGTSRPINEEYARARMLAAFAFVDAVVLFADDTPLKLIEQITPDILVKGNDYSVDQIVGAKHVMANGGEVKTVDLVAGFSTSNLIDKIQKANS